MLGANLLRVHSINITDTAIDSLYGANAQGIHCYSGTQSEDRGFLLCFNGEYINGRSYQALFNVQNKVMKMRYYTHASSVWGPWSSVTFQ